MLTCVKYTGKINKCKGKYDEKVNVSHKQVFYI